MNKYEDVCDQLDELTLRNLRLSNDLIRLKLDLDARLRDGWLSLAKTRYVAGFHRIGTVHLTDYELADSCPEENAPRVVVDLHSTSGEKTNEQEAGMTKFTLRVNSGELDDQAKAKIEMERSLLKRFGPLTPPCLKQGQRTFGTVLELVCEIASVESELLAVVENYKRLADLKIEYGREL